MSPQGGVLSLSTQECLDMSSEVHQRQWHFIKKIFPEGKCHSFIPIPLSNSILAALFLIFSSVLHCGGIIP